MTARDTILRSIQENLRAAERLAGPGPGPGSGGDDLISRLYREAAPRTPADRLALFEHNLRDYEAGVAYASPNTIAEAVACSLAARSLTRIAIPGGLPAEWLPSGFLFEPADDCDPTALETFQGVLTACTLAIAETGTIVLQSAPGQGPRRLSLVPDYHLCVVFDRQIVDTVPEAFVRLAASATLPTTFISGPSATSDIEMTRVRGVHGPRTLEIILAKS